MVSRVVLQVGGNVSYYYMTLGVEPRPEWMVQDSAVLDSSTGKLVLMALDASELGQGASGGDGEPVTPPSPLLRPGDAPSKTSCVLLRVFGLTKPTAPTIIGLRGRLERELTVMTLAVLSALLAKNRSQKLSPADVAFVKPPDAPADAMAAWALPHRITNRALFVRQLCGNLLATMNPLFVVGEEGAVEPAPPARPSAARLGFVFNPAAGPSKDAAGLYASVGGGGIAFVYATLFLVPGGAGPSREGWNLEMQPRGHVATVSKQFDQSTVGVVPLPPDSLFCGEEGEGNAETFLLLQVWSKSGQAPMKLKPLLRHLKLVVQQSVMEYALNTHFLSQRLWLVPAASIQPPVQFESASCVAVAPDPVVGASRALEAAATLNSPAVHSVRQPA